MMEPFLFRGATKVLVCHQSLNPLGPSDVAPLSSVELAADKRMLIVPPRLDSIA
jgi:hypothetical protein